MNYGMSWLLSNFKKNFSVNRYGTKDSYTPRGMKTLQLLDLFDVDLKGSYKNKSDELAIEIRNRLLLGIDEYEIILQAARYSKVFPSNNGINNVPIHLIKNSNKDIVFGSRNSVLRPNSNDDMFFGSDLRHFLLSRFKTEYDMEIFSTKGKLGKIRLYNDYYTVRFYGNVLSHAITFYDENEVHDFPNTKIVTRYIHKPSDYPNFTTTPEFNFKKIREEILRKVERELPKKGDITEYLKDLENALQEVREIAKYYNGLGDDEKDVFKLGLSERVASNNYHSKFI